MPKTLMKKTENDISKGDHYTTTTTTEITKASSMSYMLTNLILHSLSPVSF